MAIKYEIHYLPNAGDEGETRRFAHVFEEPAMTDDQMVERLAKHSCIGEAEATSVLMKLRDIIEEDLQEGRIVNIPGIGYLSLSADLDMDELKPDSKVRSDYVSVRGIIQKGENIMNKENRITEQSSLYDHLEEMSVEELTANINAENKKVAEAIEEALPAINRLISAIEQKVKSGGRLFYAGCGTGGRLATLDTIEVQNTYGIDGTQIQAIFPGGIECLTQTKESREDDLEDGWKQLQDKGLSSKDFVLGFSASGTTPFVLSILKHCKAEGIPTGCIVNNPQSPIAEQADYPVEVITGPEFVTGSTRMKAGSSQKMILDMISTSLQIRQGRVEGNKMVNAKLINHKLIDRACRIFIERHPEYADRYEEAKQLILKAGSVKKAEELL